MPPTMTSISSRPMAQSMPPPSPLPQSALPPIPMPPQNAQFAAQGFFGHGVSRRQYVPHPAMPKPRLHVHMPKSNMPILAYPFHTLIRITSEVPHPVKMRVTMDRVQEDEQQRMHELADEALRYDKELKERRDAQRREARTREERLGAARMRSDEVRDVKMEGGVSEAAPKRTIIKKRRRKEDTETMREGEEQGNAPPASAPALAPSNAPAHGPASALLNLPHTAPQYTHNTSSNPSTWTESQKISHYHTLHPHQFPSTLPLPIFESLLCVSEENDSTQTPSPLLSPENLQLRLQMVNAWTGEKSDIPYLVHDVVSPYEIVLLVTFALSNDKMWSKFDATQYYYNNLGSYMGNEWVKGMNRGEEARRASDANAKEGNTASSAIATTTSSADDASSSDASSLNGNAISIAAATSNAQNDMYHCEGHLYISFSDKYRNISCQYLSPEPIQCIMREKELDFLLKIKYQTPSLELMSLNHAVRVLNWERRWGYYTVTKVQEEWPWTETEDDEKSQSASLSIPHELGSKPYYYPAFHLEALERIKNRPKATTTSSSIANPDRRRIRRKRKSLTQESSQDALLDDEYDVSPASAHHENNEMEFSSTTQSSTENNTQSSTTRADTAPQTQSTPHARISSNLRKRKRQNNESSSVVVAPIQEAPESPVQRPDYLPFVAPTRPFSPGSSFKANATSRSTQPTKRPRLNVLSDVVSLLDDFQERAPAAHATLARPLVAPEAPNNSTLDAISRANLVIDPRATPLLFEPGFLARHEQWLSTRTCTTIDGLRIEYDNSNDEEISHVHPDMTGFYALLRHDALFGDRSRL